jgi:hypothetical protein
MRLFFVSLIFAVFTCTSLSAQSLTLEGGAAAVPTLLPSWTLGGSIQIPVVAGCSLGVSYYQWANNAGKQAVIDRYPIRDQFAANYVFPQLSRDEIVWWGNNVFALSVSYTVFKNESLSLDAGLGWSYIHYVMLNFGIGVPDAENNFSTNNKLGFKDSPLYPQNRLSGFLQARYNLSDSFALQGKIAAFGTEHFTATVGISWMPWGDKTSLVAVLTPLFAPDK